MKLKTLEAAGVDAEEDCSQKSFNGSLGFKLRRYFWCLKCLDVESHVALRLLILFYWKFLSCSSLETFRSLYKVMHQEFTSDFLLESYLLGWEVTKFILVSSNISKKSTHKKCITKLKHFHSKEQQKNDNNNKLTNYHQRIITRYQTQIPINTKFVQVASPLERKKNCNIAEDESGSFVSSISQ